MKVSTKKSRILLLITTVLVLDACTLTKKLYEIRPYIEEVSSILISEDNKKIVFLSEKHHYVFDAPPIIVGTIQSNIATKVKTQIDDFRVDTQGNIKGKVFLSLERATEDDIDIAARLNFNTKSAAFLYAHVNIYGIRYKADTTFKVSKEYQLNEPHKVKVHAPYSDSGKAVRVLLTPIAVAADGVLTIGKIVLAPIILVVLAVAV